MTIGLLLIRNSINRFSLLVSSEREAEVLKPLVSVEVVEKEEANFDTEISEEDVSGEWKLKGQVLTRSSVSS